MSEVNGVSEDVHCFGLPALAQEKAAKIKVRLRIGLREVGLPADCGLVGTDGLGNTPKSFEGEAQVVLGTFVAGTKLERSGKMPERLLRCGPGCTPCGQAGTKGQGRQESGPC